MSLTIKNLTKRFTARGTPAVSDVSFVAPTGGITTLLGPSGSGKSTVLRVIAGLELPDDGQVLFGERDFTRIPVQARGVGFVFQSYALFKHMTVRENIGFALRIRKIDAQTTRTKVDALLAMVQLEGYGARYPSQLSGGQRQRVAFARALAIEPQVLLLDEPFGALDAQVRLELRAWLRQFHDQRHVTTILVTHDQEEAMEVSDHVVVMSDGRVAQTGHPQEVYDRPATPFVASFVGGANVLTGTMKDGRASVGSFAVQVPEGSGARNGAAVQAFVRPHDVKLTKALPDRAFDGRDGVMTTPRALDEGDVAASAPAAQDVTLARVERLAWLGGYVKLLLKLSDGASMTVEMQRNEIELLGIGEGDLVMADLRQAKVFVEDYSI